MLKDRETMPKNNLLEAQEKQDSYESQRPGPKRLLKNKKKHI